MYHSPTSTSKSLFPHSSKTSIFFDSFKYFYNFQMFKNIVLACTSLFLSFFLFGTWLATWMTGLNIYFISEKFLNGFSLIFYHSSYLTIFFCGFNQTSVKSSIIYLCSQLCVYLTGFSLAQGGYNLRVCIVDWIISFKLTFSWV